MIGVDEVGRGAWAGPVYVAAVKFTFKPIWAQELRDSKMLSKKRRELLSGKIKEEAIYSIGSASSSEIDSLGLNQATSLALQRALSAFVSEDAVLIDGKFNYLRGTAFESRATTMVRADQSVPEVQAASIIAKVARDSYMARLDVATKYNFTAHVGYGTKKHRDALKRHGVSSHHRKSFKPIKDLL